MGPFSGLTVLVLQYSDTSRQHNSVSRLPQLCLTFYPALRVALVVFDSPTGQSYDGTLRQLLDVLPAGHAPHVQRKRVLGSLLSLQSNLDIANLMITLPSQTALTWAAITLCLS